MNCRLGCGACCIAPSISSALPGMPDGKPAGVPCIHLSADRRCQLWGDPRRPDVCDRFRPEAEICGMTAEQAYHNLIQLDQAS